MDEDACESLSQVDKEGVNTKAEPYATWAITLPETEPVVDKIWSQHVVYDGDGDALLVWVGEPVQGLLSQSFLLKDFPDPIQTKIIKGSLKIVI